MRDWQWAEDRLWLTWRHTLKVQWGGAYNEQECSHLAPVDVADLAAPMSPANLPEPLALSRQKLSADRAPGKLAVLNGEAFLGEADGVWRIGQGAPVRLNLDLVGEVRVFAIHGRLVVGAPDSLYLLNPKTGAAELVASGRRRPATNPVDLSALGLADVVAVPNERLRVTFTGSNGVFEYDLTKKTWLALPEGPAGTRRMHSDRIEAIVTYGQNPIYRSLSYLLPHERTNWQFAAFRLLPTKNPLGLLSGDNRGSPLTGRPLWFPADQALAPANVTATGHSNLFWTVGEPDYNRVTTNGSGIHLAASGHPRLLAWRTDQMEPAIVSLWPVLPTNLPAHLDSALALRPHSPRSLLAIPSGLVFDSTGAPGVWFLPWGEIMPRVEAQFVQLAAVRAARPPPPDQHRGKQLLHLGDLDLDGKISPVEFAVLVTSEKPKPGSPGRSISPGAFDHLDKNHDGSLDGDELTVIGKILDQGTPFDPVPGIYPPGFPGPGGFQLPPILSWFRTTNRPSFGPGLPTLGPPPPEILERYDKNKNDKMDPDEMQELIRDMVRGTSPRPRGTNAAPTLPPPKP